MASAPQLHPEDARRVVRFGTFELDTGNSDLRRQGIRVRLQAKPMQILLALLENPGTVVSREDLRKRLWPDNTFVDFERGLNSAANRLRIALGDSAENPRFVETVAGVGYRFIAPVNGHPGTAPEAVPVMVVRRQVWLWPAAGAALLASLMTWFAMRQPNTPEVRFRALTFGRGQVSAAGFSGDSEVVYSARWNDAPVRLFVTSFRSPESRALGFEGMTLGSVSPAGELALFQSGLTSNITGSALYRVPMNGGAPLKIDEHIMSADWSPDGQTLAVVRAIDGSNQVEFPVGRVLYKTSGWLSDVRVSPDGSMVAFIDHPARHDDRGDVRVVAGANVRTLSGGWGDVDGAEWNAAGDELWFTASRAGGPSTLWAVKLASGALRAVRHFPGSVALMDRTRQHGGRMLFMSKTRRLEMAGMLRGDAAERSLTWLDWSRVVSISPDGSLVLFDESGEAVGTRPVAYLYRRESDSTVRLGEGLAQALVPDGRSALLLNATDRRMLRQVPLEGGPAHNIPVSGLNYSFVPRDLTVKKGTLVTWHNDDEIEHDLLIADLGVRSGIMPAGATHSARVEMAGEFEIRCTIHAGMRARLTVVE